MRLCRTFFGIGGGCCPYQSLSAWAQVGVSGAAMVTVKLFFVMFGFYMALVLSENYQARVLSFYYLRAIRLYPLSRVTLGLTAVLFVAV